ncbi:MAG: eukaryotic-like serine/threonine-protein kinase [Thermoanaerobaculia bacterium]|jgi:serine/threonine-protein kinase|nr:eukaryotic-like serine/threonine-protein kinase [Thermoanaerobaculia bacterium]
MDVGSQLGPYEIIERIGAGGMGEVWRARDRRLQRDVAVKVLLGNAHGDDALPRFEREARAVAALSHPNILAIHDFGTEGGTLYAVMELLEGATLRERLERSELEVSRALDWGHQIAQGLAAAHERGITHRDLKPENIFVTRDGVVKILDFGLARLEQSDTGLDQDRTLAHTTPGTIMGTFAYLSPEQARGETADHRADIFAFGAVFFEMLTGRPAFLRPTAAETIVAVLRDSARPMSDSGRLPAEVEEILHHCLEKNRDERFRSARDLAFALRLAARTTAATPAPHDTSRVTAKPESGSRASDLSIAVLPFRNMSPTADAEYFSDGMTEEIINSLAAVPALQVAARTTSFAFKGRNEDIRRIGRELGVAMMLEGSVRQSGSRLRVTAQLINVDNGYQIWSNRWDRDLADVFAVQDEIAQAIASTLKVRIVEGEGGGAAAKTSNLEAYDRYLKGTYLWGQRRAEEAIVELKAAVEIDPDFADAHTALADAWAVRGYYGGVPTWEAWSRARAAVDEAERIAPDSAGVALSRGILEHYYGWNFARLEHFCRLAAERNPKSADPWTWLAIGYAASGRRDDAVEAGARGIELEPHHANVRTSQAWGYLFTGDYEIGARLFEKAIEVDANAGYARWSYGLALRYGGHAKESVPVFERLVDASSGKIALYVSLLGAAYAEVGETSKAEEIVANLIARRRDGDYVPSIDLATVHVNLGDHDAALDALERGREERNGLMWGRIHMHDFIPLRTHPRWIALAQLLGRTAPWCGD